MVKRFRALDARGKATIDVTIDTQLRLQKEKQAPAETHKHRFSLADCLLKVEKEQDEINKKTEMYTGS